MEGIRPFYTRLLSLHPFASGIEEQLVTPLKIPLPLFGKPALLTPTS